MVSAAVIAGSLKLISGRARPNGSDRRSFPSGDTTQAFAIASVLAAHSGRIWVDGLLYGVAGLVAWERMRLDNHWPSDVVAGALLGWFVGQWVSKRNQPKWHQEKAASFQITPLASAGTYGVGVSWRF